MCNCFFEGLAHTHRRVRLHFAARLQQDSNSTITNRRSRSEFAVASSQSSIGVTINDNDHNRRRLIMITIKNMITIIVTIMIIVNSLQGSDEGAQCDSEDEDANEEDLRQRMDLHRMIADHGQIEHEGPAVSADEVIEQIDEIMHVSKCYVDQHQPRILRPKICLFVCFLDWRSSTFNSHGAYS